MVHFETSLCTHVFTDVLWWKKHRMLTERLPEGASNMQEQQQTAAADSRQQQQTAAANA